jgi:lipopolysaccharide/colanic/teichoic acid biosynthesis glycosyltransferase
MPVCLSVRTAGFYFITSCIQTIVLECRGQIPLDVTRPRQDRANAAIFRSRGGEQLVSVFTLGQISSHIVLIVSFPVLDAGRKAASQKGQREKQQKPEPALKASRWVASRARRVFDCVLAATALLLLLPVVALCWLAVRCTSSGPVFFKQRRMGRHGRQFELYKFRSMKWQNSSTGCGLTVQNDMRITPVGRVLRRYKLDELPQFWNVLKGDMSLVGPRPKLPQFEMLHMPYRPGLTGQATLAFRHEEKMLMEVPGHDVTGFYEAVVKPIKAELDVRYMERATFLNDVSMLARTMVRCLHCSVDARCELKELIQKHAPQHLEKLAPRRFAIPVTTTLQPQTPVPELTDEFAGDLDDAA